MREIGGRGSLAGPRAIALLLGATLVLAALLAWQAQDAARSHRRAAEGTLRDDSRFAAREFLRRARFEVDHFGLYPIIYVLSANERAFPGGALPDREEIARLSRRMRNGPLPARALFRLDVATGTVSASPEAPEDLVAWVRANLPGLVAGKTPPEGELAAETISVAGAPRTIVYGVSPDSSRICLAFEVDTKDLAPFLERAFADGPLLPAAAGAEPIPLFLELSDAWGRVLLRRGSSFDAALGFEERLAGPRAGIFRGMTLRVSVPAEAARRLLVGGLPPSRLPVVLGALTLAAGLLAAAVALARRERAVAAMRSDFVSAVSHELRTPLAQIRLFAETLMLERTRTPEERRRSLAIIDQEARRLSHLVDNTLQFTRAERGTIALELADHDLSGIVRDAIEAFSPIAAARGVRVAAQIPETLMARVDEGAVRQILVNLLDNAVKYGPPGQQVVVGLESGPRSLRLFVEDQGPGIAPGDRERIWEKFARLPRRDQAHAGGAGIGLSVVRDLASLHGATARVEAGVGSGSRFVVEFPPAAAAPSLEGIPAGGKA